MVKAFKKICNVCKKEVLGLSEKDADYKYVLHSIKHRDNKGGKE